MTKTEIEMRVRGVALLLRGAANILIELGPQWERERDADLEPKRIAACVFDSHRAAFDMGDSPFAAFAGMVASSGLSGAIGLQLQELKRFQVGVDYPVLRDLWERTSGEVLPPSEFEEEIVSQPHWNQNVVNHGTCQDCGRVGRLTRAAAGLFCKLCICEHV